MRLFLSPFDEQFYKITGEQQSVHEEMPRAILQLKVVAARAIFCHFLRFYGGNVKTVFGKNVHEELACTTEKVNIDPYTRELLAKATFSVR